MHVRVQFFYTCVCIDSLPLCADPLIQLLVDSSRQILYTRSNSNTITVSLYSINLTVHVHVHTLGIILLTLQVYDMGHGGNSLSRVASMSMSSVSHLTLSALGTNQRNLVNPLVSLSVIPASESSTLHLLAITQAGWLIQYCVQAGGGLASLAPCCTCSVCSIM